jgi:hypothetical protein
LKLLSSQPKAATPPIVGTIPNPGATVAVGHS